MIKLNYNPKYWTWHYKNWEIEKNETGESRWCAYNKITGQYFWQTRKKDIIMVLERLENGEIMENIFGNSLKVFSEPLYL